MILVISDNDDYTTKLVLEWLDHFEKEFIRINREDKIKIKSITYGGKGDVCLQIHETEFYSSQISSIWHRRGLMMVNDFLHYSVEHHEINSIADGFKYALSAHSNARQEILEFTAHRKPIFRIGRNMQGRINKPNVLKVAESLGLKIPKTILTTKLKDVQLFMSKNKNGTITKSIDINFLAQEKENQTMSLFSQYTEEVCSEDLVEFPDEFSLTKFQEKLDKVYEVRTFFWLGQCFSQAFFTQLNKKTSLDSRNYDKTKKTRTFPINLPLDIEQKIVLLMKELDLETGSLDFVRTVDKGFVFLEVNPRGQFGYLSKSCNYEIEKIIAQAL